MVLNLTKRVCNNFALEGNEGFACIEEDLICVVAKANTAIRSSLVLDFFITKSCKKLRRDVAEVGESKRDVHLRTCLSFATGMPRMLIALI